MIDAYRGRYQVERLFRMTKSDLRARPVFRHQCEAIEAHLTCARDPGTTTLTYSTPSTTQSRAGLPAGQDMAAMLAMGH